MGQYETDTEIVLKYYSLYVCCINIPCIHFCLDIVCVCVCGNSGVSLHTLCEVTEFLRLNTMTAAHSSLSLCYEYILLSFFYYQHDLMFEQ